MDPVSSALLESWDRQTQILMNLANTIDETTRHLKPAEQSWPIDHHLAHINETRYWWMSTISKERAATFGDTFVQQGDQYVPIQCLDEIRCQLGVSAKSIRDTMEEALEAGLEKLGPYDHPVLFLQHMVWHEGWHIGLIFLALRAAGSEPSEEWEEKNIWELWRGPEE
jgi:uncharacterized damage-inducible protein DinB